MDILDMLVNETLHTVREGYYNITTEAKKGKSLRETLEHNSFSLVGELKYASPSQGILRKEEDPSTMIRTMEQYCAALSILTEPKSFAGSLHRFAQVREQVDLPLLMKDFVISEVQVDAAERIGADAVLVLFILADRGYFDLDKMIEYIHEHGLEVLLEVHSRKELVKAAETEADLLGINNRDLRTMNTDIFHTCRILKNVSVEKPLISESGFSTRSQVLTVKEHIDGILVGTALMTAENPEEKLQELIVCG